MSWCRDPELYLVCNRSRFMIQRFKTTFGNSVKAGDSEVVGELIISEHLALDNNYEDSDYYDFLRYLKSFDSNDGDGYVKWINSQGMTLDSNGVWSVVERDSAFFSIPRPPQKIFITELILDQVVLQKQISEIETANSSLTCQVKQEKDEKMDVINDRDREKTEKDALQQKISELEVANGLLQEQLNLKKSVRLAVDKQVTDLTSKFEECSDVGSRSAEKEVAWMNDHPVSNDWVPFEQLHVLTFLQDIPLMITKTSDLPVICEDKTTNVQANRFCRGLFPVVVVNVEELIQGGEDARFDPDIWGSYTNAGICYAARKTFDSGM